MKHFHLVSHDTYASGLTAGTSTIAAIASLAEGAFVLIDKDPQSANYNKSVDIAAASAPTSLPAKFIIVTKSKNGLKYSSLITTANCTATNLAYSAAVAKIIFVGNQTDGGTTYALNLPTLAAGDLAGITVINNAKPIGAFSREKGYTYEVKAGDDGADIVAGLVAAVNADSNRIVNAAVAYSGAIDGFKLTGITAGSNFQVAPIGVLRSADITDQAEGVEVATAQGNEAQMKDLEKFDLIERGLDNARLSELTTWVTDVATSGTYDQLVIRGKAEQVRPFNGGENEDVELTIAVLSTLTAASTTDKSKRGIALIASLM